MSDRSTLHIRGLTTTLISGPPDDDGANRLILGDAQCLLLRDTPSRMP